MRRLPPIGRSGPFARRVLADGPFSPLTKAQTRRMPIATDPSRLARVKLADLTARIVIVSGGLIVIGSVIAVMLLLISVIFPLFGGTSTEVEVACPLPAEIGDSEVLRVGVDRVELGEAIGQDALTAYALTEEGMFSFFDFQRRDQDSDAPLEPLLLSQVSLEPPQGSPTEIVSVDLASSPNSPSSGPTGPCRWLRPKRLPSSTTWAIEVSATRWRHWRVSGRRTRAQRPERSHEPARAARLPAPGCWTTTGSWSNNRPS